MKEYRKDTPLIYCHIPKMGGVSIRELFSRAFGENLFLHYNEPIVRSEVLIGRKPGQIQWSGLQKLAKKNRVHLRPLPSNRTDRNG